MDSKEVEKIYEEILGMSIELEPDPTVLGPRYLNEVISKCRNYMNRVTHHLLTLQRRKRDLSRDLMGEEAAHRIEVDRLLAENDGIKRLPNIKDREAAANVHLASRVDRINQLNREILDLDTIEKAVRLRHQELIRTSDNIKTQRSMMLADRVTGAGYGDEFDGPRDGKGRPLPPKDDIDEAELDRLLQESRESRKAPVEEAPEAVEEAPKVEEAPEAVEEVPKVEVVSESPKGTKSEEPKSPPPAPVQEPPPPAPEPPPSPVETKLAEPSPAPAATPVEPPPPAPEPLADPLLDMTPPTVADPQDPKTEEAAVAQFLDAGPPAKKEGEKSSKSSKKKEESSQTASKGPATGDDDFDFSDILKNI